MYFPSTSRLVFGRQCGFVSLMPALLRPSSCGPVALLHCPSVPAVSSFDRYGLVSLLPALSRPSSCGPVALLPCPSVLTVSFFLFVGVASFRSCPPYRVRHPVAPWPYYIVPPYRPSRFCSSVWLRFAPARLIASVVLWPRGLTTLSLRTDRLVFLFVGAASFRSCPPYRVRHPVAPCPYYIVPPYRPSRFCSSVWLRFAPARLIASVVLWPRGLPNLFLRTARFSPLVVSRSPVIFYIL